MKKLSLLLVMTLLLMSGCGADTVPLTDNSGANSGGDDAQALGKLIASFDFNTGQAAPSKGSPGKTLGALSKLADTQGDITAISLSATWTGGSDTAQCSKASPTSKWSCQLSAVPADTELALTASATDVTGNEIYTGTAITTVTANASASIYLAMALVNAPQVHYVPMVNSIVIGNSPLTVDTSTTIDIQVLDDDANAVKFQLATTSADASISPRKGIVTPTVGTPATFRATYTAGATAGTDTITITLSDVANNLSLSKTINIAITGATVEPNLPPDVTAIAGVESATQTTFTATVSDDAPITELTYAWYVDDVLQGQTANPITITTPAAGSSIKVEVTDIDGAKNSYVIVMGSNVAATDKWVTKASMPTLRSGFSSSVVNEKIYVFGGRDENSAMITVIEEYDPTTDTWTEKSAMPTARYGFTTSVVNGKIYIIGGTEPAVEEYDPVTDTWMTKGLMPIRRSYSASSVVNGKIYVFGGVVEGGQLTSNVEEYDPVTDTWTNKTSMPSPRYNFESSTVNGKIYVVGGGISAWPGASPVVSTVEEYDPGTDTWTLKTPISSARGSYSSGVVNGKIYVIGGMGYTFLYGGAYIRESIVEEYNPETDTWSIKTPMTLPRSRTTSSVVKGKIYTMGGYGASTVATVEEYTPPAP